MTQENIRFSDTVIEKLQFYVYRLIDPRNGETFYVGRGRGNRVFDHVRGVIKQNELDASEDDESLKIKRINAIRNTQLEVLHVIHWHNMDMITAKVVEAALIEAYPGLTNIQSGEGSSDYGCMHAIEIIQKYEAKVADFSNKKLLVISVNRSSSEKEMYEAVRFCWRLNMARVMKADYILAAVRGVIQGVYISNEWLPATKENFPGRADYPGRIAFNGVEAPVEIGRELIGYRIPDDFSFGVGNPIRYVNC